MNSDLLKARLGKLPHLPPLDVPSELDPDEEEELLDSFPSDSSSIASTSQPRRSAALNSPSYATITDQVALHDAQTGDEELADKISPLFQRKVTSLKHFKWMYPSRTCTLLARLPRPPPLASESTTLHLQDL